jgi:hypothetical protein
MATRTVLLLGVIFSTFIGGFARAEPITWTFYATSCQALPSVEDGGYCGTPGKTSSHSRPSRSPH